MVVIYVTAAAVFYSRMSCFKTKQASLTCYGLDWARAKKNNRHD